MCLGRSNAKVLKQADFWDSVNLVDGGKYEPKDKIAAVIDLLKQLAPKPSGAQAR